MNLSSELHFMHFLKLFFSPVSREHFNDTIIDLCTEGVFLVSEAP